MLCPFAVSHPTPSSVNGVSKGSAGLTLPHMCSSQWTQRGDLLAQQLCHSLVLLDNGIVSLGKNKAKFKLLSCGLVMRYEKIS